MRGTCPNPKCDNESAYSDECNRCGKQYEPTELIDAEERDLSDTVPVMRDTVALVARHVEAVSEVLRVWIESKKKTWRPTR